MFQEFLVLAFDGADNAQRADRISGQWHNGGLPFLPCLAFIGSLLAFVSALTSSLPVLEVYVWLDIIFLRSSKSWIVLPWLAKA